MPIFQNLFTNPSMETAGAAVVVRTNVELNPQFVGNSGWSLTAATGSWTADGTVSVTGALGALLPYETTLMPANAGDTWTVSRQFTVPASSPAVTIQLGLIPYAAGGSLTAAFGPITTIQPGQTLTMSTTGALPATATSLRSIPYLRATPGAGAVLQMSQAMAERASVALPYFDGATPASGDFTYGWTSAANASTSTQSGVGVATVTGSPAVSVAVQSTDWAAYGTKSLRIIPVGASNGSCGAVTASGLTVGATYTVMGLVRVKTALTGALYPNALGIQATGVTVTYLPGFGVPANVPGVSDVRVSFVATAVSQTLVFMNGSSQGGGDVWWDQTGCIAGTYTGPWFDGGSPYSVWDGVADASTSTMTRSFPALVGFAGDVPSNACPNVQIAFDAFTAGTQTVNVLRTTEGRTMQVRGGVSLFAVGGAAVVDFEAPSIEATYQAEQFDINGLSLGFTDTASITLGFTETWVTQPLNPSLAITCKVFLDSDADSVNPSPGGTFWPEGATVGTLIGGQRTGLQGKAIRLRMKDMTDADMFSSMFGSYTTDYPSIVLIRTPGTIHLPAVLFAGCLNPHRVVYGAYAMVTYEMTVDEVRPPFPGLVIPLLRRMDLDAAYPTRAARSAAYATRLARDTDYSLAGFAGPA